MRAGPLRRPAPCRPFHPVGERRRRNTTGTLSPTCCLSRRWRRRRLPPNNLTSTPPSTPSATPRSATCFSCTYIQMHPPPPGPEPRRAGERGTPGLASGAHQAWRPRPCAVVIAHGGVFSLVILRPPPPPAPPGWPPRYPHGRVGVRESFAAVAGTAAARAGGGRVLGLPPSLENALLVIKYLDETEKVRHERRSDDEFIQRTSELQKPPRSLRARASPQ